MLSRKNNKIDLLFKENRLISKKNFKIRSMSSILLLNGPNLNLLGEREPDIYGDFSLEDIEKTIEKLGKENNIDTECFQSNAEHELVDRFMMLNLME